MNIHNCIKVFMLYAVQDIIRAKDPGQDFFKKNPG